MVTWMIVWSIWLGLILLMESSQAKSLIQTGAFA
jgi:hypothetical protein